MFAPAHVRICAGKYLVLGPGPKTKFLYLTPAYMTPAYSFISPGPPRAVVCLNMSKNAQAECKTKARFQVLLRRSRFSRRSLKEHRQSILTPQR